MGVVYVSAPPSAPQDSSEFREMARDPHEVVYRLRDALGRAYAVREVRSLSADSAIATAMHADTFRADRVAYALDARAAGGYPGSASARIRWLRDEPDEVRLEVDAGAPAPAGPPAFVVLADAWFPGWAAQVDGTNVPLWRVDRSLRGVRVPAGRHEI